MKKYFVLCVGFCAALAMTSCKSSESAYKKAYEKAKAQEQAQPAQTQEPVNVVAPVETKPVTETRVVDNVDNVQVRQEDYSLVSGAGLKNFSVVVGAFSVRANAEGLQQQLKDAGYDAQIVKNEARNLYRVIAATFDSKSEAARSRNEFRAKYPDAWLLAK
ncbi:MAG: SPOR domain-containing protein [Prevotella sp.]|mgnify:FL=1|uniref:SPOR domain-containing protein n=1 Tax=Prevotella sp. P5-92 TaxID=2024222 RepID=UPI000B965A25|nr:SPOR domain-containing protein [Prevotella sp. P5-92]MCI7400979.1 SPOR domain-containing protein [Prevotella sp.]MDD6819346.1 SPOR domain-containing protein [Prevotella sp.]MDY4652984.1 SPOR domain-containing protein [Prevotella sp.]OYP54678.1 cell division protein [Prevotella sp. P5-92]